MIKIIKPGNVFKVKCPKCNCIFQYEQEDVTTKQIGRDDFDTVVCPQCDETLILNAALEKKIGAGYD